MKKIFVLTALFVFSTGIYAKTDPNQKKSTEVDKGSTNGAKEGMSFQTAIKVGEISEEYEYIRKKYPEAKVIKQTLVYDEIGAPYDILTVEMPNGQTFKRL